MDSSGILWTILIALLCGVPLTATQHVIVRVYWRRLGRLPRYALGTATICLCLSLSALVQEAYLWALAPWLVAAIVGGATAASYLVADRLEGDRERGRDADRAELEERRAQER